MANYFGEDNKILALFLNGLEQSLATLFVSKIARKCKVKRKTVFNWKYGQCRIPWEKKPLIESAIGAKIFN